MITINDVAWAMGQINDAFRQSFAANNAREPFYPQIARDVPVTAPTVTYTGLGARPGMKLLRDRMEEEDIKGYKYVLTDDEYYDMIAIRAKFLEDEGTGQYLQKARSMGEEVPSFFDQTLIGLLENGQTGVCYDGQPFYNTQHPVGVLGQPSQQAQQSNTSNLVLSQANLYTAIGQMAGYKDDKGNAFGSVPSILLTGTALAGTAYDLLRKDQVGDTYLSQILRPVVSPYIQGNHWQLLDVRSAAGRPLIIQRRTDIGENGLDVNDNLGSKDAWFDRQWKFGVLLRAAFGYGAWQTGYGAFPS